MGLRERLTSETHIPEELVHNLLEKDFSLEELEPFEMDYWNFDDESSPEGKRVLINVGRIFHHTYNAGTQSSLKNSSQQGN